MSDRVTDEQVAEWDEWAYECGPEAAGRIVAELRAERVRWLEAMTRMDCETGCGNCNVCRLRGTIHVHRGQLQASRRIAGEAREWARWFSAERDEARLDLASELVAIAAKQQWDSAQLDAYRDAMRDVRRILADFGITNPPPRLRAVLEGLVDE